jgi:hypothetical protein
MSLVTKFIRYGNYLGHTNPGTKHPEHFEEQISRSHSMTGLRQSSIFIASTLKIVPAPLYGTYNCYELSISFLK